MCLLIPARTQKRTNVKENAKLAVLSEKERRTGPPERFAVGAAMAMERAG
jgi:hypothetical protein